MHRTRYGEGSGHRAFRLFPGAPPFPFPACQLCSPTWKLPVLFLSCFHLVFPSSPCLMVFSYYFLLLQTKHSSKIKTVSYLFLYARCSASCLAHSRYHVQASTDVCQTILDASFPILFLGIILFLKSFLFNLSLTFLPLILPAFFNFHHFPLTVLTCRPFLLR